MRIRRRDVNAGSTRGLNDSEFIEMINSLDSDYQFDSFKNSRKEISLKHLPCGNIFSTLTHNFYKGNSCPICSKKHKLSFEKAKTQLKESRGDDFSLDESDFEANYKNNLSVVTFKCNRCNNTFKKALSKILYYDQKCPFCETYKRNKDTEYIAKEIQFKDPEYSLVGEYIDSYHNIEIRHSKCGKTFFILPSNFLSHGQRCPSCLGYVNENYIFNLLSERYDSTDLFRNYIFPDCKYMSALRFDFFIKSKNTVIEYDGEQHFKPIYGNDEFEKSKVRDSIKDEYCKTHNINIIRIPYWEFDNVNEILKEVLN